MKPGGRCHRARHGTLHDVVELVERLSVIAVLRSDADAWIDWHEAVDEIDPDRGLVTILEDELAAGAATRRHTCFEPELDFAESLFQRVHRWKRK